MIPILMGFAFGGTAYGMAEESLAFYAIVLPVFIAARYDAVTAVAVIMLGCRYWHARLDLQCLRDGHCCSMPPGCRLPMACAARPHPRPLLACRVIYVMRYAGRVRLNPARSLVCGPRGQHRAFPRPLESGELPEFTRTCTNSCSRSSA